MKDAIPTRVFVQTSLIAVSYIILIILQLCYTKYGPHFIPII
jgi:hypothetical protein